jgi:hypothetical protein
VGLNRLQYEKEAVSSSLAFPWGSKKKRIIESTEIPHTLCMLMFAPVNYKVKGRNPPTPSTLHPFALSAILHSHHDRLLPPPLPISANTGFWFDEKHSSVRNNQFSLILRRPLPSPAPKEGTGSEAESCRVCVSIALPLASEINCPCIHYEPQKSLRPEVGYEVKMQSGIYTGCYKHRTGHTEILT